MKNSNVRLEIRVFIDVFGHNVEKDKQFVLILKPDDLIIKYFSRKLRPFNTLLVQ